MYKKTYEFEGYILKSFLEYYFALWLNELKHRGYVEKWTYEDVTFPLSEPIKLPYQKQLKTKVKTDYEHIFSKASFTEDFCIYWTKKAENIFYLDPTIPIKCNVSDIPFRLGDGNTLISYVDVKSTNISTTSSSVSYPYKSKWVYKEYGIVIHKIHPFSLSKKDYKKTLFHNTFYPKQVILEETYKRDSKYGKKGDCKIKNYSLIEEYLHALNK